jgi:hypothetical protein
VGEDLLNQRPLQDGRDDLERTLNLPAAADGYWPTAEIAHVRSKRRLGNQVLAARVNSRA